ncbi:uncharacterized protein LOC143483275 [Brachyhypopomus gauderio]|uniref:uncharacterized protein LOC143483275 n=1 Tax=Brachyhypopomus gauderio TaxID=698409 RepID=UPI0040438B81
MVNMTGLKKSDAGWYWCSVGDVMVPVYLTVTDALTVITSVKMTPDNKKSSIRNVNPHTTPGTRTETPDRENQHQRDHSSGIQQGSENLNKKTSIKKTMPLITQGCNARDTGLSDNNKPTNFEEFCISHN